MAALHFEFVSPESVLFSGDVDQVDLPGAEGDMGILAGHAPLVTALRPGIVTIFRGGAREPVVVIGGFAEVGPAGLTVLADRAVARDGFRHGDARRRNQGRRGRHRRRHRRGAARQARAPSRSAEDLAGRARAITGRTLCQSKPVARRGRGSHCVAFDAASAMKQKSRPFLPPISQAGSEDEEETLRRLASYRR